MKPKLTIIISAYNNEQYIEKAIHSVLMQSLTKWEMFIINDASDDHTGEIIRKLIANDKRVTYIENTERMGITFNIKRLISLSRTELIARVDGDDYWLDSNKLAEQYDIMKNDTSLGMVGTWARIVDSNDKDLYTIEYPVDDDKMRSRILYENPFVTSSIVFRKPVTSDLKNILPANKHADDFNLVLEIGRKLKFNNVPKYYTAYRINPNGISQSKYTQQISDTMNIVRKYKKDYPGYIKALFLWTLRKHYPIWLKGKLSMLIKRTFKYYQ